RVPGTGGGYRDVQVEDLFLVTAGSRQGSEWTRRNNSHDGQPFACSCRGEEPVPRERTTTAPGAAGDRRAPAAAPRPGAGWAWPARAGGSAGRAGSDPGAAAVP